LFGPLREKAMDETLVLPEQMPVSIRRLLLARISIVTFLLGMTILGELKGMSLLPGSSLVFPYTMIGITYGLSLVYLLLFSFLKRLKTNVSLQVAGDVVIITFMVYFTGGVDSIYSIFYALVIIYAVLFLGRRGGVVIASACSVIYGGLLDLEYYGLIHPPHSLIHDYAALSGYVFSRMITHILSFYLTAFLASFVVEREKMTRSLLAEKEDAFDQLDVLHKSIVESVNVGILTINTAGKIKSFNRAAQEITDYALADVEDVDASRIFPLRADLPAKRDSKQGPSANRFEMDFLTKKNRKVIIGCSLSSLMNNRGERVGDIVIFQDITAIKKMEESYEKGRRMAFIGEMAAHLAHEMRNPLASISGSIQVLSRDLHLPESDERLMRIILRGKEQLENFMKDFLLLARPRLSMPETVDTKEIIEEVLDALQCTPDFHEGIEIRKSLEQNATLFANRTEIRHVLWNLLLNALQSIPGEGILAIETRIVEENGKTPLLQILISDTGYGIEETHLPHIFEPFYTTKDHGTGLGLAIVNRIVESQGGGIELDSTVGMGTRCLVSMPLKVDEKSGSC
jgi:two-component system, NtrC family, sensor histidine kinase PilS